MQNMHTLTQSKTVFTTTRGEPYFPSDVVTARFGKQPSSLRIVLACGEALNDHYPDEVQASARLAQLTEAMRGIVGTATPGELPYWATSENAAIASTEVLSVGGTRERAAQAYARTLMGIGDPASCIDAEHMLSLFEAALNDEYAPVLIWAGMPDSSHASTKRTLSKYSPLARLTLLAVNQGVDPGRLCFEIPTIEKKMLGENGEVIGVTEPEYEMRYGCAYTFGEDDYDFTGVTVPRKSYHWCSLNSAFFLSWAATEGRPQIVAPEIENPERPSFDESNTAHQAAMVKLAAHFDAQGLHGAASDLRTESGLTAHADGPQ